MGERFKNWLQDKDHLQVLKGYSLDKIGEDLQKALEEVYATPYVPSTNTKRNRLVKEIAIGSGNDRDCIRRAVMALKALDEGVRTYDGTDPQTFEGGQHYRGSSHVTFR